MITPNYVKILAQYNTWQNQNLYKAADNLSDDQRKEDRGAFFGSIHETLCHLLWGDQIWMSRFADKPAPAAPSILESKSMVEDWPNLHSQRTSFDILIENWADTVSQQFLDGELSWFSGAVGKEVTKPTGMLVVHMFNHQTHHRGQVHAMLTQAGCSPDDTDLFILKEKS
jgi:uncharacterized damage-inducible protein DinB